MDYTKQDLISELKLAGLKSTDTVMVHSAYSSVKNIEGGAQSVLDAFKTVLKDGLLLLPAHTWASIKEDYQIMDKKEANSCVGYLTNAAILDKSFVRSNHPTHSVVAWGKKANEYVKLDDSASTPVSPSGCFGSLKKGAKILFIGAPLSKNTFVHSIEEEMDVPDRFTEHIYTFLTKTNAGLLEFSMPRHYSTKNPHISDNYEKLLPVMLALGIAKKIKILDSTSYLVDAKQLRELVIKILKKDIHAFDDLREVKY